MSKSLIAYTDQNIPFSVHVININSGILDVSFSLNKFRIIFMGDVHEIAPKIYNYIYIYIYIPLQWCLLLLLEFLYPPYLLK